MTDFFLSYLKNEKRASVHTYNAYKADLLQLEEFLDSKFKIKPEKADFRKLRFWIAELSDNKLEKRSINRKIASIKAFYRYLLLHQKIKKNPAEQIKSLKTPKRLPDFFDESTLYDLFNVEGIFENDFFGQQDKLIIDLFYQLGIRLSELINIKISDIDFHGSKINVLGKRNKMRIIPFTNTLQLNLKNHLDLRDSSDLEIIDNQYLLTTKAGRKLYPMFVQRLVKKYMEKVCTKAKISPHVLRHSFATHLLNRGAELNAIKELLGHANLTATQIYTHNSIEQLKEVYEQAHPKS